MPWFFNGAKTDSSNGNVWIKVNLTLIPHTQINSVGITELNTRAKTIKLTEENIEENLCDVRLGKYFLHKPQKLQPVF